MRWLDALKMWNEQKGGGKWCIPRAGTTEHAAIRRMMDGESAPRVAKKKSRAVKKVDGLGVVTPQMPRESMI